jgi:hypothetical protein
VKVDMNVRGICNSACRGIQMNGVTYMQNESNETF